MEIITGTEAVQEYEEFVVSHENGHFMQSASWAQVKRGWEHEIVISRDTLGNIRGGMLLLVKKLPVFSYTLLYAPRGPVWDFDDRETLQDLLMGVHILAAKHNAYLFRMDPSVMADNADFIAMMHGMGFSFKPNQPDLATIQTRVNCMLLDLDQKTPEEILASVSRQTRYKINLSKRHGVECRQCDRFALSEFYRLYQITAERDGFECRSQQYFEDMFDHFSEEDIALFLCYYNEQPISGAICVRYAGKATYLYGASGNEYRNKMPNYLMQWTMIQWAMQGGCTQYDFGAVPVDRSEKSPFWGIYTFKKSFNTTEVEFAGEFDYVFSRYGKWVAQTGMRALSTAKKMGKRLRG